jgi:Family of unknown function (DUF6370)
MIKVFMKSILAILSFGFSIVSALGQEIKIAVPDSTKKIQTVEASCGKCQFGLPGKDCELAVRINGKAYYVDGTHIDSHGDAHSSHGFCNTIRKAQVQGEVADNRFKVSYFKLIPMVINKADKPKGNN